MAKQVNSADAFDLVAPAHENKEEATQESGAQLQTEAPQITMGNDKKRNLKDREIKTTIVIPADVAAALAVAKISEGKSYSKITSEALIGYLAAQGYYKP